MANEISEAVNPEQVRDEVTDVSVTVSMKVSGDLTDERIAERAREWLVEHGYPSDLPFSGVEHEGDILTAVFSSYNLSDFNYEIKLKG